MWDKFKPDSKGEAGRSESNIEIQITIPAVSFDVSGNGSKSANLHSRDTIVRRKDSARVTNGAKNIQQNDIKKFNKKYGTNF